MVEAKRIVVGYDGSEHADRALERARSLAAERDAELIVVSSARLAGLVRDPALATSAVDPVDADWARSNLDRARERLDGQAGRVRTVEAHGEPGDSLVRVARDEDADLIVVGTRGLNLAKRALLGSVSTKVVHDAPCDVLVVR